MIKQILTITFIAIITGCSSNEQPTKEELYENSPIPRSEYTMKEIYESRRSSGVRTDQKIETSEGRFVNKRPATWEETRINPYVLNETSKANFKKLYNPTITIFFMPSLTKEDRMPRPAWMSEFSLYDKDEYALPGEVSLSEGQFPTEGL